MPGPLNARLRRTEGWERGKEESVELPEKRGGMKQGVREAKRKGRGRHRRVENEEMVEEEMKGGGTSHGAQVHKAQQASPTKARAEHSSPIHTDDKLLR